MLSVVMGLGNKDRTEQGTEKGCWDLAARKLTNVEELAGSFSADKEIR